MLFIEDEKSASVAYNIPNAKIHAKANLFALGTWSCHTSGIGNMKIKKSVKTSKIPTAVKAADKFPQWPPRVVGSQNMEIGRHVTMPGIIVYTVHEMESPIPT